LFFPGTWVGTYNDGLGQHEPARTVITEPRF
jgi:hypothetical protein